MADLGMEFDTSTVPDAERQLLPVGTYDAHIIESELKVAKSGEGELLKLTWEILSGPYERWKVWQQITIRHSNSQTQEIGQRQLKQVCAAYGLARIRNSEELHFKPASIRLTIKEDKTGQYDPQNQITKVSPYGGAASVTAAPRPAPATAAPQPQTAQAPAAAAAKPAGKRPWDRSAA